MEDAVDITPQQYARRRKLFFGIVGVVLASIGAMLWHVDRKPDEVSVDAGTPAAETTAQIPPEPDFTVAQNDTQGYDNNPWGITIDNFIPQGEVHEISGRFVELSASPSIQYEASTELAVVFGIPWRDKEAHMSKDFSLVPRNFQTVASGTDRRTHYVFYKGHLAYVYLSLLGNEYDAALADLKNRYSQTGFDRMDWEQPSDSGGFDTSTLSITVFKRGDTNTQIYLLQQVKALPEINMQSTMVHVLYIPTASLMSITQDIEDMEERQRADAVTATQPDLQKLK